jgi:hypothetical protein
MDEKFKYALPRDRFDRRIPFLIHGNAAVHKLGLTKKRPFVPYLNASKYRKMLHDVTEATVFDEIEINYPKREVKKLFSLSLFWGMC